MVNNFLCFHPDSQNYKKPENYLSKVKAISAIIMKFVVCIEETIQKEKVILIG